MFKGMSSNSEFTSSKKLSYNSYKMVQHQLPFNQGALPSNLSSYAQQFQHYTVAAQRTAKINPNHSNISIAQTTSVPITTAFKDNYRLYPKESYYYQGILSSHCAAQESLQPRQFESSLFISLSTTSQSLSGLPSRGE